MPFGGTLQGIGAVKAYFSKPPARALERAFDAALLAVAAAGAESRLRPDRWPASIRSAMK